MGAFGVFVEGDDVLASTLRSAREELASGVRHVASNFRICGGGGRKIDWMCGHDRIF
jgi:hypothetical protein